MERLEDFESVQSIPNNDTTLPWYQPKIRSRLTPEVRNFYEEYTGRSGDDLISHLHEIRDRAWPYGKYPCVGSWLFLHFPWRKHSYDLVLDAARTGIVLDLGCCFGQDLRRMVVDGVPVSNMWATDLHGDLWELGKELFQDRDRFDVPFVEGDISSDEITETLIKPLTGKVGVVVANQFFHLFDQDRVYEVARRVVAMSQLGCVLIGFQMGADRAVERQVPWGTMWFQDVESWKRLWDTIGEETGTEWTHDFVRVCEQTELGWEKEDYAFMGEGIRALEFVTRRVK